MGYAFNLALESTTPEIANVMKYINTLSNTINNANINSCETAAGLVGTVWPKTHEAQKQVSGISVTAKGYLPIGRRRGRAAAWRRYDSNSQRRTKQSQLSKPVAKERQCRLEGVAEKYFEQRS